MKALHLAVVLFSVVLCAGYAGAQHNHGGGGHGGGHQGQPSDDAVLCPLRVKNFEPTVKNTETGVEITLTAITVKDIAGLRKTAARHFSSRDEMEKNCPARVPGAKTGVEETDGGVKITITAQSPASIKTIQAAAAYACKRDQPDASRVFKTYACPMGEFQSSKPGKCPKCGMELAEKK